MSKKRKDLVANLIYDMFVEKMMNVFFLPFFRLYT